MTQDAKTESVRVLTRDKGPTVVGAARIERLIEETETGSKQILDKARAEAEIKIADADRAAEARVRAGEHEINELRRQAEAEAEFIVSQANARVTRAAQEAATAADLEAQKRAASTEAQATVKAEIAIAAANEKARAILANAQSEARDLLSNAHLISNEVSGYGQQALSDLDAFAQSLRDNGGMLLDSIAELYADLGDRIEDVGIPHEQKSDRQSPPRSSQAPESDEDEER